MIYGYARVSSKTQLKGNSIEEQRLLLEILQFHLLLLKLLIMSRIMLMVVLELQVLKPKFMEQI